MGPQSLTKQPSESRLYSIDFSPLLAQGETISSVSSFLADTPTGASALSISAIGWTTIYAQARIAGGTNGTSYKVTALVLTSLGNILEGEGALQVKDV